MKEADLSSQSDCCAHAPTILHTRMPPRGAPYEIEVQPLDPRHLAETEAVISFVVRI
jgi:hypothetical protein